jgi:hypothetical protein
LLFPLRDRWEKCKHIASGIVMRIVPRSVLFRGDRGANTLNFAALCPEVPMTVLFIGMFPWLFGAMMLSGLLFLAVPRW